jgi:hypothetical protein
MPKRRLLSGAVRKGSVLGRVRTGPRGSFVLGEHGV